MLSENIPLTMASSANDSSLSLFDFIEYSIKNDLNIVTSKWLAHSRKISIAESKNSLQRYWETLGKQNGYCATFSVLSGDESSGYSMELIDSGDLEVTKEKLISSEIFAIHAVPLKDRSVQLGMINVPIFDLPGEIEAPWIDLSSFPSCEEFKTIDFDEDDDVLITEPSIPQISQDNTLIPGPSAAKKMKMVKTTRTFMENGYQMTEVVNELVPCDESIDVQMGNEVIVKVAPPPPTTTVNKPKQQSSMMSFFKKK